MAAIRLSNEVTTRMRACRYVLSAFFTEGAEQVANLLLGMTQRNLGEGEEPPGFAGVINVLGRSLRAALDRLVSADLALYAALTFEAGLRRQRGLTIDDLGFQLVGMRRTVIGQYVEPDLDGLGLQPVDARDTITVVRRVELLDERFGDPNLDRMLGKARFGEPQDVRALVGQMKATNEEVNALDEQINEAKRKVELARAEKQKAMEDYDQIYLPSVRIFEDFCRYVGRRDLADRIRLSVRSSRIEQGEDGEGFPGDPPVDQEGEPASAPTEGQPSGGQPPNGPPSSVPPPNAPPTGG